MKKSPYRTELEHKLARLKPCSCPCVTVRGEYWRHKAYVIAEEAGMTVTTKKAGGGEYQVRKVVR